MRDCLRRCPKCPRRGPVIQGDGPRDARIMFIGEAPGKDEKVGKRPFIGKSGREFNEGLLPISGNSRNGVYVTNTVKCLVGTSRVVLADGSTERIDSLYKTGYRGYVKCVDPKTLTIREGKVTYVFRSPLADRQLYSVSFESFRPRGGRGVGTIVTGDHELLTDDGWVRAEDFTSSMSINTGTPGFSEYQRRFLSGMVLGDTHYTGDELQFSHATTSSEYLELKAKLLSNFNRSPVVYTKQGSVRWSTGRHPQMRSLPTDSLSVEGLAVWYLDDGCFHRQGSCEIACTRLSWRKRQEFVYAIRKLTGETAITQTEDGRIYFHVRAVPAFHRLIARLVPKCLQYKLREDERGKFDPRLWECNANTSFYDRAIVSKSNRSTYGINSVYCLEVEDYHNFVTLGGVVHNCWWANSGDQPPEEVMESCTRFHLERELEEVQPEVIVPMGAYALRGMKHLSLLDKWVELDLHHGSPIRSKLDSGAKVWMYPVYHPAAGMRQARIMQFLQMDFRGLRNFPHWMERRTYGSKHYAELKDRSELKYILNKAYDVPMAIDTETTPESGVWCLTFSVEKGTGYMLRTHRGTALADRGSELMGGFNHYLKRWKGFIYLHYALHDFQELEDCGVYLPEKRVKDTMMMAYHRGYLPQGLKALAYKLLGERMREFDDVVTPYSTKRAIEYLESLAGLKFERPEPEWVVDPKTGRKKLYWANPLESKVKALLKRKEKGADVDPFALWKNWSKFDRDQAEAVRGRFPLKSIAHVPLAEAVEYACEDANMTLQVGMKMEGMRIRRMPWGGL